MKLFETKRTQNKREIYICGIRVLTRERGKAAAARKHKESLAAQEDLLQRAIPYLATENSGISLPVAKKELPDNTVWQLWLQGENNAPDLVRMCLNSVKQHTQGRPYVLLTKENIQEYLDIPDFIIQKYEAGNFGHAHFSDLVRLMLLCLYGGTWVDATVLLTSPIPDKIEQAPFFVFKSPDFCLYPNLPHSVSSLRELLPLGNPYHCSSSWFIHAARQNPLISKTLVALLAYWKKEDKLLNYFLMHLIITAAVITDAECRHIFETMPSIANHCPHILQNLLGNDYNQLIFDEICTISFAHKLTHRHDTASFPSTSFYSKLLSAN